MTKPTFLKILLAVVVALVLTFVPKLASARRESGSHGGRSSHGSGGSHGEKSHGGGSFRGGGHSSSRGGGRLSRDSHGGSALSSVWLGGGHKNKGGINRSNSGSEGFSSALTGNSAFRSTFGRGNYGSAAKPRDFGYSGGSQRAARDSSGAPDRQRLFGNSRFGSGPEMGRASANSTGGGWNSFRNSRVGRGAEMSRDSGSNVQAHDPGQRFGNSRFGSTPGAGRGSTNSMVGGWNSFNNSRVRRGVEMSRSSGSNVQAYGQGERFGNPRFGSTGVGRGSMNSVGAGWNSFSHSNGGAREGMSRKSERDMRPAGQWNSFGSSRNGSFARNVASYSFSPSNRASVSDIRGSRLGFRSNRFSSRTGMSRFSAFSSFPGGRSNLSLGGVYRGFGAGDFASAGFESAGFGGTGFSDSLIGSSISIIPNLLFGGLLHLGTSFLGGGGLLEGGLLAGNAISLAAHWLSSGDDSSGYGRVGPAGIDSGFDSGGLDVNFGFASTAAWPRCNRMASSQRPAWGWSGYCGPSPYYPRP
jgi:hypothetical protein